MTGDDARTVAERIRTDFDALTRAERQLANALLARYPLLGIESITAVAEAAQVSTPTVVRMAKKIGFSGFPEMQAALRGEVETTLTNPIAKHDRWTQAAPESHILNRFAESVTDNIRQTLNQLDPAVFDKAVALLGGRENAAYVAGGRITRSLADYLFNHLQVIRPGVTLIPANTSAWPHFLLDMKPGDVLALFDIRRYEHDLQRFAEMARERGVDVILFTDQWGSPAAKSAALAINARIEAPSAWDSTVVILFIVEALIAAVEDLDWNGSSARMRNLEELFDRTRQFRKFV